MSDMIKVYKLAGVFPDVKSVYYADWHEMMHWVEDALDEVTLADKDNFKITIEIEEMSEEEFDALDKDWY